MNFILTQERDEMINLSQITDIRIYRGENGYYVINAETNDGNEHKLGCYSTEKYAARAFTKIISSIDERGTIIKTQTERQLQDIPTTGKYLLDMGVGIDERIPWNRIFGRMDIDLPYDLNVWKGWIHKAGECGSCLKTYSTEKKATDEELKMLEDAGYWTDFDDDSGVYAFYYWKEGRI